MIDVIVADHEEVFGIGMMETLAVTDDVFLVVQTRSPDQLLKALQTITPKVLVLSTRFLAELARIEPVLKRNRTALLLLAEDNDQAAYVRWLRAGGLSFVRSMGPVSSMLCAEWHEASCLYRTAAPI